LILATRRPAFYLAGANGADALAQLCDVYTTLLEQRGVVPHPLGRLVRETRLRQQHDLPGMPRTGVQAQKAVNAIRADLLGLLGIPTLYQLDRLDLTVATSIDEAAQTRVTRELRQLRDAEGRAAAGLTGPRLLPEEGTLPITYSILLCEATADGNFVRVQTDSFAGPRDVNRHTKLELGSTAKLRTLISYLEIVERLHEQLAQASPAELDSYRRQYGDPLTQWFASLLEGEPSLSLEDALSAALARRYSASPAERFFTAGGVHTFSNFDDTFDTRMPTVQEAFSQSVNLVFIRLMRDVVRYHEQRIPFARELVADGRQPIRTAYLERFADQEGQQFMRRFHRRHVELTPRDSIDGLLGRGPLSPLRAARVYLAVLPDASATDLGDFLRARAASDQPSPAAVEALHLRVSSERLPLADLGYLTAAHPLELWVAEYLARHPKASLTETIVAGAGARQEAYRWLMRTQRKELQDTRIRTVLEAQAFTVVHEDWRRLGYSFSFLVPSYATAIGSSGDSPESLAQLMGILVNDGVRRPIAHVTELKFAEQTPFETHLEREERGSTRVLSVAVARAAKDALVDVVANGTGRRVRDVLLATDGTPLRVGGKTGTGDNQHVIVDQRGERVASYARNRTAALVFFVDNHFGIITAHVEGPEAGDFTFTSALPSQILRHLAPTLEPLLQRSPQVSPASSTDARATQHYAF
jgi:membrane peptidoglycan carboxypeptidase